ncbi:Orotate phosphoribosyltransferase [Candidatus Izimaplasma bacterium HR1]|uniref:orotate phosphoribosyltransferase n=1 Tax=Candidatus Izimoplasma sp. HR1 TaxID=1541959 RepID=UPI0004F79C2E|nr:Orotate phosphoribosyltransferase [Candidatus Izimaplasma bacterium HR1]
MEKIIAKELLKINAVFLRPNDPFTWASGIKSPIYCDNRLTLSYPKTRHIIEFALAEKVKEKYPQCEYIMGTSTAGIAHAALVSELLALPMGYVRSSSKDHGRGNAIEGKIIKGAKVVVIEDLISTGGSCVKVVNALKAAEFEVLGVVAIFSYNLKKATKVFKENNTEYHTISNYDVLKQVALEKDYIKEEDLAKLDKWKQDPTDESWMK